MSAVDRSHPTYFMIDYESSTGKSETLQDWVSREADYDIAFCKAWQFFDSIKDNPVTDPRELLSLLDKIQKCALTHFDKKFHERAEVNYFDLSNNNCSDEEGIIDLIKKVWIEQDSLELLAFLTPDQNEQFYLSSKKFCKINKSERRSNIIFENEDSTRQELLEKICSTLIPIYRSGVFPNGASRLVIWQKTPPLLRQEKALKMADKYFKEMKVQRVEIEKIKTMVVLIRDLMQLHLYYDGNGRSLYILANFLLYQNRLQLCYPRNMCMFDANSVPTMVTQISEGQKRFVSLFLSVDKLTKCLVDYHNLSYELHKIIPMEGRLRESMNERNLNLMFRLAASTSKNIGIFRFLLAHRLVLNIDIFSKGEKSGNALEIATKFNNNEAIELLKKELQTKVD